MPSIVVINEEVKVLYQDIVDDMHGLEHAIRDGGLLPEVMRSCPEVRISGLIIFVKQPPRPKRSAPALSARQASVLQLLAKSYSPDQIALKLGISESTTRLHISQLKKKFGTDSRDQMMAMAGQLGLCNPFD